MKTLAKYLGGSISYGLNTPQSDRDVRGVFLNEEISDIIGLGKNNFKQTQNLTEDIIMTELKHYLNLLRNGNTMCLEMLYNDNWLEITNEWKYIQSYRNNLIDSHKLFKCLKGYCQSERRLVLGERTGVLGGKRRLHLDQYGYSYKNAVQFLRLALAGSIFFQEGYFPVNIRRFDKTNLLYDIKMCPQKYSKDDIIKFMDGYEEELNKSYDSIKVVYKYDFELANKICYELYMPILLKGYQETNIVEWYK